jgi:hypothetical protein
VAVKNPTAEAEAEVMAKLLVDTGIDLSMLAPICTTQELAPVVRTSDAALAQDRYRGTGIPFIKFGRRVRYLRTDVARYLAANRSG